MLCMAMDVEWRLGEEKTSNNMRYADNTTLLAKMEEDLKQHMQKIKKEAHKKLF